MHKKWTAEALDIHADTKTIFASSGLLRYCFFRWNISVIFSWDILVTEKFRSFVSQLY